MLLRIYQHALDQRWLCNLQASYKSKIQLGAVWVALMTVVVLLYVSRTLQHTIYGRVQMFGWLRQDLLKILRYPDACVLHVLPAMQTYVCTYVL
jgi:hypothetical protein